MTKFLPLALLAAAIAAVPAPACAPAPMHGEYVDITSETALIIWDAEAKGLLKPGVEVIEGAPPPRAPTVFYGLHGGLTADEALVPLLALRA